MVMNRKRSVFALRTSTQDVRPTRVVPVLFYKVVSIGSFCLEILVRIKMNVTVNVVLFIYGVKLEGVGVVEEEEKS